MPAPRIRSYFKAKEYVKPMNPPYKALAIAGALFLINPAQAQPRSGTVYGVYPEGVMVNSNGGAYLVPTQHATFRLGNLAATWSSLQPGQAINFSVPQAYWPSVVQIQDPYQWKLQHHPKHPHGGPPGQLKKMYPSNGSHYHGKGYKGHGKWK